MHSNMHTRLYWRERGYSCPGMDAEKYYPRAGMDEGMYYPHAGIGKGGYYPYIGIDWCNIDALAWTTEVSPSIHLEVLCLH